MITIKIKKWISGAIIGSVLVLGGVLVINVGSPEQILMEDLALQIAQQQETYFSENGQYWQGLVTHKKTPKGLKTLDNLSKKPHYQDEGWNDFINLPSELPFSITMNTYKAPTGYGYEIVFEETGTTTIIGFGPEKEYRTKIINHTINATST